MSSLSGKPLFLIYFYKVLFNPIQTFRTHRNFSLGCVLKHIFKYLVSKNKSFYKKIKSIWWLKIAKIVFVDCFKLFFFYKGSLIFFKNAFFFYFKSIQKSIDMNIYTPVFNILSHEWFLFLEFENIIHLKYKTKN